MATGVAGLGVAPGLPELQPMHNSARVGNTLRRITSNVATLGRVRESCARSQWSPLSYSTTTTWSVPGQPTQKRPLPLVSSAANKLGGQGSETALFH